MAKKKTESGSVNMEDTKQVTKRTKLKCFWFSDGTIIEAETAQEAAKIKKLNRSK